MVQEVLFLNQNLKKVPKLKRQTFHLRNLWLIILFRLLCVKTERAHFPTRDKNRYNWLDWSSARRVWPEDGQKVFGKG